MHTAYIRAEAQRIQLIQTISILGL